MRTNTSVLQISVPILLFVTLGVTGCIDFLDSPKKSQGTGSIKTEGTGETEDTESIEWIRRLQPWEVSWLQSARIQELSIPQIQAFSTAQVSQLNLRLLSNEQLQALTPSQISALTPHQLSLLSMHARQDIIFAVDQVRRFSAEQLSAFFTLRPNLLDAERVAAISPETLRRLNEHAFNTFIAGRNIPHLRQDQFEAVLGRPGTYSLLNLSDEQVANLTVEQIQRFSEDALGSFSAEAIASLVQERINSLDAITLRRLFQRSRKARISFLEDRFLASLSIDKFQAIVDSKLESLAVGQIRYLNREQVQSLDLSAESLPAGLPRAFTSEQIAFLQPSQLRALHSRGCDDLYARENVFCFSPEQFANFNGSQLVALSPASITRLTPQHYAVLRPELASLLSSEQVAWIRREHVSHLSEQQIRAFSPGQIASLEEGGLSGVQLPWLSTPQVLALTSDQLEALNESHHEQILETLARVWTSASESELQQLRDDQVRQMIEIGLLSVIPSDRRAWVFHDPDVLSLLSTSALNQFSGPVIASIPPRQIRLIRERILGNLSSRFFAAFSAEQIEALTPGQILGLDRLQIRAFSAAQIAYCSPEMVTHLLEQGLSWEQLAGFSEEQIISLYRHRRIFRIEASTISHLSLDQILSILSSYNELGDQVEVSRLETFVAALSLEQLQGIPGDRLSSLPEPVLAQVLISIPHTFPVQDVPLISPSLLWRVMETLTRGAENFFLHSQIQAFTQPQIEGLDAQHLVRIGLENLTPTQIQYLTEEQFRSFSMRELNRLTSQQRARLPAFVIMEDLLGNRLRALLPEQIPGLGPEWVRSLTGDKISFLSGNQLNAFSTEQIHALVPQQWMQLEEAVYLRMVNRFSPSQISQLNLNEFSSGRLEFLTWSPEQISAIPPIRINEVVSQFGSRFSAAQVAAFSSRQVIQIMRLIQNPFSAAQLESAHPALQRWARDIQAIEVRRQRLQEERNRARSQQEQQRRDHAEQIARNSLSSLLPLSGGSMDRWRTEAEARIRARAAARLNLGDRDGWGAVETIMNRSVTIRYLDAIDNLERRYPQAVPLAERSLLEVYEMVLGEDPAHQGRLADLKRGAALRYIERVITAHQGDFRFGYRYGPALIDPSGSGLTNKQVLSLAWYAVQDPEEFNEFQRNDRKWAFIESLANIQRAHNDLSGVVNFDIDQEPDQPSCGPGTFKRLIEHLDLSHSGVRLTDLPDEGTGAGTQITNDMIVREIRNQHQALYEQLSLAQREEIERSFESILHVSEDEEGQVAAARPYHLYLQRLREQVQRVSPLIPQDRLNANTNRHMMQALLDIY